MKFKDNRGREWNVQFNFRLLCRIEDELGYKIMENPSSLPNSLRAYVEMLWVVCEKQAKELGVEPDDFGEALSGKAIQDGIECMIEELAVFFEAPQPVAALVYREGLKRARESGNVQLTMATQAFARDSSS